MKRTAAILVVSALMSLTGASSIGHAQILAPQWTSSRLPTPDHSGRAFISEAASCPSISACYVAGDAFANTEQLPWSGYPALDSYVHGKWSARGFTALGDTQATITQTLTCPSTSFCVGGGSGGPGDNEANNYATPYLLTKKGRAWAIFRAPSPSPRLSGGAINDVACIDAQFCVAVGDDFKCTGPGASESCNARGLIEMDSQGTWLPSEAPATSEQSKNEYLELTHVACNVKKHCVAIDGGDGTDFALAILTLSNGYWTARPVPLPSGAHGAAHVQLNDVACPTSGACAIVGSYTTSSKGVQTLHPLLLSETGAGWNASTLPDPQRASLTPQQVACLGPSICVAAGVEVSNHAAHLSGFERADGKWSVRVLPERFALGQWGFNLSGIACASTTSCMAVGSGSDYPLAESGSIGLSLAYLGGRWSEQPVPLPQGVPKSRLFGAVSVTPRGTGYLLVGNYTTGQSTQRGMVSFYP